MFLMQENPRGIANFDGLEPRLCADIKGIMAPEIGPQSFGTFGKQAPGSSADRLFRNTKRVSGQYSFRSFLNNDESILGKLKLNFIKFQVYYDSSQVNYYSLLQITNLTYYKRIRLTRK